jgi:biofilm PGA synthesis lipoprotein PgaB
MMASCRRVIWALLLAPLLLLAPTVHAAGVQNVVSLCYHDVGPDKKNPFTIQKDQLVQHFNILRANGYHPISLQQYLQAQQGLTVLPDKPVLLTFDDGYLSFYRDVYPLLREYGYPAVLSVVTAWQMSGSPPGVGPLTTWAQMREMEASGLVTIASHTHALHRFMETDTYPVEDTPAAVALEYRNGKYETPEAYRSRIAADFKKSQEVLTSNLGHPVKVLTWPFGEYSLISVEAAKEAGFETFFTLGDDVTASLHQQMGIRRTIIYGNPGEKEFTKLITTANVKPIIKMAQLDLDYLYDESPVRFEKNIETAAWLLNRSGTNTVVLQAFTDEKGDGNIRQVYFYTTAGPVKANVFSHVVQRLQAAGIFVYAWMPSLACQWLIKDHPEDAVQPIEPGKEGWYRRASPFSPRVREKLKLLYRDFAAYNPPFDGILFQDDVYLSDWEDASPAAKAVFRAHFNRDMTPEALKDPEIQKEWTRIKIQTLNDLTIELANEVRVYRPQTMVARNIYAPAILDPKGPVWLSQDFNEYLKLYDYTVVMAYPYMEKAEDPAEWLQGLTQAALSQPGAKNKVVFKLQTYDWWKKKWLSARELENHVRALKASGATLFSYYPLNVYSKRDELLPY